MTEEEAHNVIRVAHGLMRNLTDKMYVDHGYVSPSKRLKRYLPVLESALDTLTNSTEGKDKVAYRSMDKLLSHTLPEEEVYELIRMHKEGKTLRQLGNEFGVHRNTVSNILKRAKQQGVY